MRITQGMYSFLPELTDEQITLQVVYFIDNGCAIGIEYTDDPHPRNTYWEMWDRPVFDLASPRPVMEALQDCREAHPNSYIRIVAFDATHGWESLRGTFIVQRPANEEGFALERTYGPGRMMRYRSHAYALDRPAG